MPKSDGNASVGKVTLPANEVDELILDIESRLRERVKMKGEDPDSPVIKELLSRTSLALRKVLCA